MGVCITSNYKGALSLDGGYFGFHRLRNNVAKAVLGKDFYKYEEWLKTTEATPKEELSEKCKAVYEISGALWEFVTQSDCEGKLDYKTCGELYNALKDKDGDFSFCYDAYYKEERKLDFIKLLKGCYSKRANLIWW